MNRGIYGKIPLPALPSGADRNPSPPKVSRKTGVSANLAGDFREILAKVAAFRNLEISAVRAKMPYFAGFSRQTRKLS